MIIRFLAFNTHSMIPDRNIITVLLLLLMLLPVPALQAQSGSGAYSLANELMREGKFEEAYEILEKLLADNPRSYAIFDRTVTALINLQRFDDAIEITQNRLKRFSADVNTRVKLGEIFHIAGDIDQAMVAWNGVIEIHSGNVHAYRRVAEIMNQRRLYREAVTIYEAARTHFQDPNLFAFEIANNYLAAAEFEPAIREFLDILERDDQRVSLIQRQLMNYDERRLYDLSIIMTEERLGSHRPGTSVDVALREFLIWLNLERSLYRRALAAARTLDRYTDNRHHAVFRTGRQLRNRGEYDLAEQAFTYYIQLENHPLRFRSFEELSRTYQDWAASLIDRHLDFDGAADSLHRKAFTIIDELTSRNPGYDRLMQTLVIQSELALDFLKEPDKAAAYLEKMQQLAGNGAGNDSALMHYIEGRILLFKGDFTMARVSFTRSNRIAESSDIADKSRYYLGLGDFYNKDFTYSRLQLRSLERQNHSWQANNALQLRYMIQEGFDPTEDDNPEIARFSRALYLYDTGRYEEVLPLLAAVLDEPRSSPLHNESILLLTRSLRKIHPETAFLVISSHLKRPSMRHQPDERLLWEQARLGETAYHMQKQSPNNQSLQDVLQILPAGQLEQIVERMQGPDESLRLELNAEAITSLYEELLINYPNGFYSSISRDRIRALLVNLQNF